MADDDHRVLRRTERFEQIEHLHLHGCVERGGRLVCDQQFWTASDRRCDQRALAHAAGELMWILLSSYFWFGYADGAEQIDHFRGALIALECGVQPQRFGDFCTHGSQWIERAQRILHDKSDAAAAQFAPATFI